MEKKIKEEVGENGRLTFYIYIENKQEETHTQKSCLLV